jgi:hypothetical protein
LSARIVPSVDEAAGDAGLRFWRAWVVDNGASVEKADAAAKDTTRSATRRDMLFMGKSYV